MINPLDTPDVFSLELMNPNPVSSKTKDGPKYRVSFEMRKDDWQMFMDANTNGMILEMQGRVQHQSAQDIVKAVNDRQNRELTKMAENVLLKGGPLSIEAAQWCNREGPNEYAQRKGWTDFKSMVYADCKITSRRELDHDSEAATRWGHLKIRYETRPAL